MRAARFALIAALALGLSPTACKKHRQGGGGDGDSAGAGGAAGATAGNTAENAGRAGAAPGEPGGTSGAGGGSAGSAGAPTGGGSTRICGDGVRQLPELCDGDDFGGLTCLGEGFDRGELGCVGCLLDTTGCSGTEQCTDARDNDGDRAVDCADADCTASCADACAEPIALEPPASATGLTLGHTARYEPSCGASGEVSGPELIYRFSAAESGVAEATLTTDVALVLAVTRECGAAETELACAPRRRVEVPVQAGESYYVQVDGFGTTDSGQFSLGLDVRPVVCGDGHRDLGELCDDGDVGSGDGCSASCELEINEVEPNDTPEQATAPSSPVVGTIGEGDVDVIRFEVSEALASVSVVVGDFGEGACAAGELDAVVEIVDSDAVVLAMGADDGPGGCPQAIAGGLMAGTYYVVLRADPGGSWPTFSYAAAINVDLCGDGNVSAFEECDDGDRTSGDGCAADCTVEPDEAEPNDVISEAEALPSPIKAKISPDGDVDVFQVELTDDGSIVATALPTVGDECTNGPETRLTLIRDDGGSAIAEGTSSLGEPCASLAYWTLPAGTYYLRVSALANAQASTFGYSLSFEADVCGNGDVAAAEQCDDGNTVSGDGCRTDCLLE